MVLLAVSLKEFGMQIFPSIVSSNLLDLKSVIITLDPYVDGWHVDIMDNHFVPIGSFNQ